MALRRLPATFLAGQSATDRKRLRTLWAFSQKYLGPIPRRSGESYAENGLEVALTLRELSDDASLLCCALVHDICVHPDARELLKIIPLRGAEKQLVRRMYGLRRLHIDESTKDLDTVIDAFTKDNRLLLLRMAHRLNDVRHLDRFEPKLRREIAIETLHMYTAIAGRLGFHVWRYEMEDACFMLVNPRGALALRKQFELFAAVDQACLKHTKEFLDDKLKKAKIRAELSERIKGIYSTYRKMIVKGRQFREMTDRLALRIVVPTIEDCYRVLGVVHACMHPIPGKLKDYIGAPKENGYRSIHTVIYPLPGVTEQPIEIQIRTAEMHEECERGVASHAHYKTWSYALKTRPARVNLFRNLESLRAEARSPEQFEKALRSYFREDHMAVFDESNNLYHIKKTSSVLHFVKLAHPERWRKIRRIRINGRLQSLDSPLRDGDTVEVTFSRSIELTEHGHRVRK